MLLTQHFMRASMVIGNSTVASNPRNSPQPIKQGEHHAS